jgi:hypothetical protein
MNRTKSVIDTRLLVAYKSNMKIFQRAKGLIAFGAFLWIVLVTTYAMQEGTGVADKYKLIQMQSTSCSSSSSSGGAE